MLDYIHTMFTVTMADPSSLEADYAGPWGHLISSYLRKWAGLDIMYGTQHNILRATGNPGYVDAMIYVSVRGKPFPLALFEFKHPLSLLHDSRRVLADVQVRDRMTDLLRWNVRWNATQDTPVYLIQPFPIVSIIGTSYSIYWWYWDPPVAGISRVWCQNQPPPPASATILDNPPPRTWWKDIFQGENSRDDLKVLIKNLHLIAEEAGLLEEHGGYVSSVSSAELTHWSRFWKSVRTSARTFFRDPLREQQAIQRNRELDQEALRGTTDVESDEDTSGNYVSRPRPPARFRRRPD